MQNTVTLSAYLVIVSSNPYVLPNMKVIRMLQWFARWVRNGNEDLYRHSNLLSMLERKDKNGKVGLNNNETISVKQVL